MNVTIKKTIYNEAEIPTYLKECLDKISSDEVGKDIVNYYYAIFNLDSYFERVFFNVHEFHIQVNNLKLWTMMRLYYGFEIEYDFRDKLFKIGGYETEQLTSKTISGLVRKLEKQFNKDVSTN